MKKCKLLGVVLLALSFSITACGQEYFDKPTLIKAPVTNETYAPVEMGICGDEEIEQATVVPMNYCYFWNTTVDVEQVNVEVGQHVKQGDILAEANIGNVKQRISEYRRDLDFLAREKSCVDERFDYELKEQQLRLSYGNEAGDEELIKEASNMIEIINENKHYNELLYGHRVGSINKNIEELEKINEQNYLVADHEGEVTFILDTRDNKVASSDMNIVVVSDYEDCYLEYYTERSDQIVFEREYALFNNEKHPIEYMEYSGTEKTMAGKVKIDLPKRCKVTDGAKLPSAGINVPIVRNRTLADEVLIVSRNSVYEDEKGFFVYVRNATENEKRYIEVGKSDDLYYEVVSGLEQGELVYEKYSSAMPEEYTEEVVRIEDYALTNTTKSIAITDLKGTTIKSPTDGNVNRILAAGYEVKKGDVICEIDPDISNARINEIQREIDNARVNYDAICKSVNEQSDLIREQITAIEEGRKKILFKYNSTENNIDFFNENGATATDAITEEDANSDVNKEGNREEKNSSDNKDAAKSEILDINDPYIVDELKCRLEMLRLDLEMAWINYQRQQEGLEKQLEECTVDVDVSGKVSIKAEQDGVIMSVGAYEDVDIKKNDKIVTFGIETNNPKIEVRLTNSFSLPINGVVDIYINDVPKYKCKVVGSDVQKYFITKKGNNVYATYNKPLVFGKYDVICDDENIFRDEGDKVVHFPIWRYENAMVIPVGCLEEENVDGDESTKRTFVWKKVGNNIIKQYVKGVYKIGDPEARFCAITGLKEGDVVLKAVRGTDSLAGDQPISGGEFFE